MQITTTDGTHNVASKGLGGAALGLGIAGTVGLLNQLGNGGGLFGGGLFGGNGCGSARRSSQRGRRKRNRRKSGSFV